MPDAKPKLIFFTRLERISIIFVSFLLAAQMVTAQNSPVHRLNALIDSANVEDKALMLVFSGSDWCAPCINFKANILTNSKFTAFADSSLLIYIADFPRKKNNKPTKEQEIFNAFLAEKYNKLGYFPFVLILNEAKEQSITPVIEARSVDEIIQYIQSIVKN